MAIKLSAFVLITMVIFLQGCGGQANPDQDTPGKDGPSKDSPSKDAPNKAAAKDRDADSSSKQNPVVASPDPVALLKAHLAIARDQRPPLDEQSFADLSLTREQADAVTQLLHQDHVKRIRSERAAEMKARLLRDGDLEMPFFYKVFGEKPEGGRSLYISMHGGGGGPKAMNDGQWRNQMRLYTLDEGVYVAPRAPTDTWNLWHQAHIDRLFDRLIENMIVFEDVNPNKVYIMGYSAGGDGVYQLAPRMADRFAAASMMAGHPNETSPLGLRNLPFSLHVGGNDAAYKRNIIAGQWKQKLADLQKDDPEGYVHWAKVYEGKGHWLDREDAAAIPWMAKYTRNPFPKRIIWKQDDVTHTRFYWLAVAKENAKARSEVIATLVGQTIDLQSKDVQRMVVRLNDQILNLDKPIKVTSQSKVLFEGKLKRTIAHIATTLAERGDAKSVFTSEVTVALPVLE